MHKFQPNIWDLKRSGLAIAGRKALEEVRLKENNQFVDGLAAAFLFNEGAGDPIELVQGALANNVGLDYTTDINGRGIRSDAASDDATTPSGRWKGLENGGDSSAFVICAPGTGTVAGRRMFHYGSNLLNNTGGLLFANGNNNVAKVSFGSAVGYDDNESASNFWLSTSFRYGYTHNSGTDIRVYRDGALFDTMSTIQGRNSASDTTLTLFQRPDNGADRHWNGTVNLLLLWNKALSAEEHFLLSTNPHQLFEPKARWPFYSFPSGAIVYTRDVTDGIFMQDQTAKERSLVLIDTMQLDDDRTGAQDKQMQDALLVADATIRVVDLFVHNELLLDDSIARLIESLKVEGLLLDDSITTEVTAGLHERLVTDYLALSDARSSNRESTLRDSILLDDAILPSVLRQMLVLDAIQLDDVRLSELDKALIESMLLTDGIVKVIERLLISGLILADTVTLQTAAQQIIERTVTDALLLFDYELKAHEKTQSETLLLNDQAIKIQSKQLLDSMLFGESSFAERIVQKLFADGVMIYDAQQKVFEFQSMERLLLSDVSIQLKEMLLTEGLLLQDTATVTQVGAIVAALVYAKLQSLDLLGLKIEAEGNLLGIITNWQFPGEIQ